MQVPTWDQIAGRWLEYAEIHANASHSLPYLLAQFDILTEIFPFWELPIDEISVNLRILEKMTPPKEVEFN